MRVEGSHPSDHLEALTPGRRTRASREGMAPRGQHLVPDFGQEARRPDFPRRLMTPAGGPLSC
jgi:hypothetical protein